MDIDVDDFLAFVASVEIWRAPPRPYPLAAAGGRILKVSNPPLTSNDAPGVSAASATPQRV